VEVSAVVKPDAIDWRHIPAMGQFRKDWLVVLSDDGEDALTVDWHALPNRPPPSRSGSLKAEARGYEDGAQVWRVVHGTTPREQSALRSAKAM
jgi:hypothetical protein